MLYSVFNWKKDLKSRKKLIIKNNLIKNLDANFDSSYHKIESSIFISAFIIRKLIESDKLTTKSDSFNLKIKYYKPINNVNKINRLDISYNYNLNKEYSKLVKGKEICNWIIHSYIFIPIFKENILESFYLSSDFDRNKILYKIKLDKWLEYIDIIIEDRVFKKTMSYNIKKKDYIFINKE